MAAGGALPPSEDAAAVPVGTPPTPPPPQPASGAAGWWRRRVRRCWVLPSSTGRMRAGSSDACVDVARTPCGHGATVAFWGEVASLLDAASSGSPWVSLVPVGGSGAPGTAILSRSAWCGPVASGAFPNKRRAGPSCDDYICIK